METKFKVGDKVKIPKTKSFGTNINEFNEEIINYDLDYLLITHISSTNNIILKRNDNITLFYNVFSISDLELYEEPKQQNMNNNKQVFLSLETAKMFYNGNDKAAKQFALDNYTKEELEAKELPRSWKELDKITGYFINEDSNIDKVCGWIKTRDIIHKNVFPTESLAKGNLALSQLLQLRDKYNENDTLIWDAVNKKYSIYFNNLNKNFNIDTTYYTNKIFTFKTKEKAELFLENFKELLWEARELI